MSHTINKILKSFMIVRVRSAEFMLDHAILLEFVAGGWHLQGSQAGPPTDRGRRVRRQLRPPVRHGVRGEDRLRQGSGFA